jgi:L-2-hydroxyglutarate oxidase LhgO
MPRIYLLFRSTHETMKAEAVLQGAGLPAKVVMKPAGIAVDCGLAVRTGEESREAALQTLRTSRMEPRGVYEL